MRGENQGKSVFVPMGFGFFKNGDHFFLLSARGEIVGNYPLNLDLQELREKVARDIDEYLKTLSKGKE